jgi:type I restriction enzyme S subunit
MKLPQDWTLSTIGGIAEVRGGKRLPKGRELVDYDTGFPYIRVTDMYDGGVNTSRIRYVPKDIAPSISRYRIYCGELFITVAGTLGLVGEIPEELDGANLTENADKLTQIKINRLF